MFPRKFLLQKKFSIRNEHVWYGNGASWIIHRTTFFTTTNCTSLVDKILGFFTFKTKFEYRSDLSFLDSQIDKLRPLIQDYDRRSYNNELTSREEDEYITTKDVFYNIYFAFFAGPAEP